MFVILNFQYLFNVNSEIKIFMFTYGIYFNLNDTKIYIFNLDIY